MSFKKKNKARSGGFEKAFQNAQKNRNKNVSKEKVDPVEKNLKLKKKSKIQADF